MKERELLLRREVDEGAGVGVFDHPEGAVGGFLDVADVIQRGDPDYIAPLRMERMRFLDPAKNPDQPVIVLDDAAQVTAALAAGARPRVVVTEVTGIDIEPMLAAVLASPAVPALVAWTRLPRANVEHQGAEAIDDAVAKGVTVMCFDSDAPRSKRLCYYGTEDVTCGKLVMAELARVMDGKGAVAILAGIVLASVAYDAGIINAAVMLLGSSIHAVQASFTEAVNKPFPKGGTIRMTLAQHPCRPRRAGRCGCGHEGAEVRFQAKGTRR